MTSGLNSEAIKVLSRSTQTQQGNLSGVGAFAQKRFEDVFVESRAGSKSQGTSFVTSKQRTTIDVQGQINGTGVNSDLAIEGNGMFVVGDGSGAAEKVYTRRGDFRQDKLGFWVNGAGKYLFAWKLDEDGNLPVNNATLASLEAVNFANTKGDPRATTSISIAMNLNSDRAALRGAGPNLKLSSLGKNNSTGKTNKDDIIIPETLRNSGIEQGFTQKIKAIPPGNQEKTIEYGGIAVGRGATGDSPIFGATSYLKRFDPAAIPQGSGLTIKVGNETLSFEAVTANPDAKSNQFNSIDSLAKAINNTSRLKATIDSATGAIYIAAKSQFINETITFGNTGGANFVQKLGLTDVAAPALGVERFNSLLTMQSAVNKGDDVFELKAAISGQGIDVTAKNPEANFEMVVDSFGIHKISQAILGGDGSELDRATISITSPNNNLNVGDYVRMANLTDPLAPDGIYAVTRADSNGFSIALPTAPVNFPAAGQANIAANNATWQKTPGKVYTGNDVGATLANNTLASVAGPGGAVTIASPDANIADGDIVYISGIGKGQTGGNEVNVPDGYYVVANGANMGTAAATFEITSIAVVNPIPPGTPDISGNNFSWRKISEDLGGGFVPGPDLLRPDIFEIDVANVGTNLVSVYLGNHNYSSGDYISFRDVPAAFNGITLEDNVRYKISNTTNHSIEIEVVDSAGVVGVSTGAGTSQTDLAPNIQVNNGTRVLEYFGLQGKQKDEDKLFEASYDPNDVNKSLSSITNPNITKDARAFPADSVFSQSLRAFDSLGSEFNLQIHFAKLNENEWAVEVASNRDPETGLFDAEDLGDDGKIAHGKLIFNTDGTFREAQGGIANAINLQRRNGSALTDIKIDWENSQNEIKSGTASQFSRTDSFEFTQQDGQSAGTLTNIEVDEEGYVVGTFDSGEVRKLYRVPIATFNDINGLTPGSGGTYRISKDSGELLLKGASAPGAGKIIGSALELSNTDTTTELLVVKERSLQIQANARVVGVQAQDQKTILSETQ